MAEIYCSDIDSDSNVDDGGKPPFVPTCGDEEPAFITPAQYKERTGREYPGNAPVWYRVSEPRLGGKRAWTAWELGTYGNAKCAITNLPSEIWQVLCAFGDLVPPHSLIPEILGARDEEAKE
jgi:hypothetical protein